MIASEADILQLQRCAGNSAVSELLNRKRQMALTNAELVPIALPDRAGTVQRQAAATEAPLPATEGTAVSKPGIVDQDGEAKGVSGPGLNLRAQPSESARILRRLPHNTAVFVDRELPGDWYFAIVQDDATPGYLAKRYVNTAMPGPGARLHRIAAGETALDIVRHYYDPKAYEWGKDARFYVNVLVFVNSEAHRGGIRKPSPDAEWDETQTLAGLQIWIPSLEFADTLKGQVSSGSITYEAWSRVKDVLSFLAGVGAFIGGLVVGALESLKDLVAGIVEMAWSILKSLFTASIISDARSLMKELSKLSAHDLAEALGDWLEPRWNNKSFFKRWYWRGWIIGYVIAEVLMTFFTAGVVEVAKTAARTSKLVGFVKKLSAVAKLTEAAQAMRGSKAVIALKDAVEAARASKVGRVVAKTGEVLSEAHRWAGRVLLLPAEILKDLTVEGIEQLRKLSPRAMEVLKKLSTPAKRWLLGCASACRVNFRRIEKELAAGRDHVEAVATKGEKAVKRLPPGPEPPPQQVYVRPLGPADVEPGLGDWEEGARIEVGAGRAGAGALPKHHVFPQEWRDWFEKRGFRGAHDIDNFTVELDQASHMAIHGGGDWRLGRTWPREWNRNIMRILRRAEAMAGRRLKFKEIMDIVKHSMARYGINKPFVPYL